MFFMKKDKHPTYHEVLFVDSTTGHRFVCGSTLQCTKREVFEGKEYPTCYLSISSASHPFFRDRTSGARHVVDTEHRIDRFVGKYAKKAEAAKAQQQKAPAAPVKPIVNSRRRKV